MSIHMHVYCARVLLTLTSIDGKGLVIEEASLQSVFHLAPVKVVLAITPKTK